MYRMLLGFVLMLVIGACAGGPVINHLKQSEDVFEAAKKDEAAKKAEEMKAKADAAAAETARKVAGKSLAAAVQQEAVAAEARLAAIKAEADAARKRACELDPDLCPKTSGGMKSVPQEFVDVEITSDWAAPKRLTPYPDGWMLKFTGGENILTLTIKGLERSWLRMQDATVGCYRFKAAGRVERCSTTVVP